MLLFGFVGFDDFAPDPTMMHAVSEDGHVVRRDAAEIVSVSRAADWRLRRADLHKLGTFVEHERERAAEKMASTSPTLIVDVGGDDWDQRARIFVAQQRSRSYIAASADEFVKRALPSNDTSGQPSPSRSIVQLADGRRYQPRIIEDLTDVEVIRRAVSGHMPVSLSGPPGTGKSTAVVAACAPRLEILRCYEGMTREDVFGMLAPVPGRPGEFSYADGPVPRAMLAGTPLLVDDANWMPPGVQALLLPAAADDRAVEIIDRTNGPQVVAAPGFSLVFTENPGIGFGIIEPLRNRIALLIRVPVDYDIAADQGVPPPFIQVAKERQERAQQAGDHTLWLPSVRELVHASASDDLFGLSFAAHALVGKCPADQQREFIDDLEKYITVAGGLVARY